MAYKYFHDVAYDICCYFYLSGCRHFSYRASTGVMLFTPNRDEVSAAILGGVAAENVLNHRLALALPANLERSKNLTTYPQIARVSQSGAFFC